MEMNPVSARRARLGLEQLGGREMPAFLAPITSAGGGVLVAAGDLNHDGWADAAAVGGTVFEGPYGLPAAVVSGKVQVSLSNGNGTFQAPVTLTDARGYYLDHIAVRDVNGDGHPDIEVLTFAHHYDHIKVEEGSGSMGGGI